MTEQPTGPRCGNNPNVQLTPGDRKAVDDFKARLALQASAKPYIDSAVWVDGDPLMEVVAVTVWERCARDDENMPQLVCDDPRTIAAFAAAVARAHAAAPSAPADRAAILREAADKAEDVAIRLRDEHDIGGATGAYEAMTELRRLADEAPQPGPDEITTMLADATDPTLLRWGLNDVMWGDDDSVTVLLSGPDLEPYWLELDPERAAVLRQDLAGPDGGVSELEAAARTVELDRDAASSGESLDYQRGMTRAVKVLRLLDAPEPAAVGAQQPKEAEGPRTVCVCGHTRGEHLTVSGRLLCDECDPDSTDNLVCKEFDAL